ncbi:MAG: hypothetical protein OXH96_02865 [Spirochaetaceae bacterium]|nr:hypothetical protein [Spirochaetaceae bacterium]
MNTRTIGAAKFKEQCLALLDALPSDGLIVTKHGKPVARVVRYPVQPRQLIGALRGKLAVRGDILTTGVTWDAAAES